VILLDLESPMACGAATDAIRRGDLVVLPTDTVYGLAVACGDTAALAALYSLKGRPASKAIPLLVAGVEALEERAGLVTAVPEWAYGLAARHWPGALTLVLRAAAGVPTGFAATDGTLALRCPASALVLAIIAALGRPLACTSANLSGQPPALRAEDLPAELCAGVALLLDGGPLGGGGGGHSGERGGPLDGAGGGSGVGGAGTGGTPSTIVDCTGSAPLILRQGGVEVALQAPAYRSSQNAGRTPKSS